MTLTGFEKVKQVILCCLTQEMTTNGLLEDVETLENTYYREAQVEEPVIWMTQHPTRINRNADISGTVEVITPFEFDCGVYEVEIEDADGKSQNLAWRTVGAIRKNWLNAQAQVGTPRTIKRIDLDTYSPIGYVPVQGKSDKVAVTGVILNVIHILNWQQCCQQINNGE